MNLANLGALLKENGADAKQFGSQKIFQFLKQFPELLTIRRGSTPSDKAWVVYTKPRDVTSASSSGGTKLISIQHTMYANAVHAATELFVPSMGTRTAKAASGSEEALQPEFFAEGKTALSPKVCATVQNVISGEADWVNPAGIGRAFKGDGTDVKPFGFQKISLFLEQFPGLSTIKRESTPGGKARVACA